MATKHQDIASASFVPTLSVIAAFIGVLGVGGFVIGEIHSRYYFHRLGFPHQFMDLPPSFYVFRSLAPIAIGLCYSLFVIIGLLLVPVTLNWFSNRTDVQWRLSGFWQQLAMAVSVFIATSLIGLAIVWRIDFWYLGYNVVRQEWLWFPLLVLLAWSPHWLKKVFHWEEPYLTRYDNLQVLYWTPSILYKVRLEQIKRRNARISALNFLLCIFTALLSLGAIFSMIATAAEVEAEHLIQGDSRNSVTVDFTCADGAAQCQKTAKGKYILVMMLDGDYYVTLKSTKVSEHPEILVIPESEINDVTFGTMDHFASPELASES